MKKIILLCLVLATGTLSAEEFAAHSGYDQFSGATASTNGSGQIPSVKTATASDAGSIGESAAPAFTPKKHLNFKQKIQQLWVKISSFDFASLNILNKIETFAKGKKRQNSEALDGIETGEWKHTKRLPSSGKAKEIADQLDKAQQESLKKLENIN
jgi:hypothetical protein